MCHGVHAHLLSRLEASIDASRNSSSSLVPIGTVGRLGIEPSCPALQTGAITRLALCPWHPWHPRGKSNPGSRIENPLSLAS